MGLSGHKVWVCPLCGRTLTNPIPVREMSHTCPKKLGQPVYLKPKES